MSDQNIYFLQYVLEENPRTTGCKVVKLLGKGSFAEVFLVNRDDTNENYACKVISRAHISNSEEVTVAHTLRHPNICSLKFVIEKPPTAYLFMEYVQGPTLKDAVEDDFYAFHLLRFARELVAALSFMHENLIAHRDLKPSNVMFGLGGQLKLIDFGFARTAIHDTATTFCGTIQMLAPEVYSGSYSPFKSDVWSCALLLYYGAKGTFPFGSNDKSIGSSSSFVPKMMRDGTPLVSPPPPRHPEAEVSRILGIVDRMMRIAPNLRPSMPEVSKWLESK